MTPLVDALWVAAVALPFTAALLLALTRSDDGPGRALLAWSPAALLPAAALTVLPSLVQGVGLAARADWLVLGTSVGLDQIGRPLLLVGVLLYGAALASLSLRPTDRAGELAAFLLVCFVGNLGVYAATDAVTFYLSFALMSFAAFGLVLHTRSAAARRAGRIYLVLAVASESAVLAALMLVVAAGGTRLADAPAAVAGSPHASVIVGLLLLGFGVKAGLVPLHVWLPLAHPAAPPAASAVLSGAMVKAGLVGWFRFLPLGHLEMDGWGLFLVLLALLGAFGSVPVGAPQRDPKVVLAYSTISQMGFLATVVGVALAAPGLTPACISAGVIYAVHHGLAKGALFLGVPIWAHHGHGRTRPLVVAGLVVAGLAVAGAPLSSGAVGKYASKSAVEGVSLFSIDLVHVLPLVATGSTILLLRYGLLLWRTPVDPPEPARRDPQLWAWLVLVVTSATLPWALTDLWVPVASVPDLEPVTVWAATWPILLGLGIGAVVAWAAARSRVPVYRTADGEPAIPAGDLVVAGEALARRAGRAAAATSGALGAVAAGVAGSGRRVGAGLRHGTGVAGRAEDAIGAWRGSGAALLIVLVVLALAQAVAS